MFRFIRNITLLICPGWFRDCHKKLREHNGNPQLFLFGDRLDAIQEDCSIDDSWTEPIDLLDISSFKVAPAVGGATLLAFSVALIWMGIQFSDMGLGFRSFAIAFGIVTIFIALKVSGFQFIQFSSAIATPDSIETVSILGSQTHRFDRTSCCVYFFPSNLFSVNCDAIIVSGTSISNYSVTALSSETARVFVSMYGKTYQRVSTIDPKASS